MPLKHQMELFVLIAVARLEDDAYGVTIRDEIERVTTRPVSIGGVYNALDRLEREGLVKPFYSEPRAERGGRARRHYELTGAGHAAVKRERTLSLRLWEGYVPEAGRRR
jgi:DNA-binding PadR family transcriptional regulator